MKFVCDRCLTKYSIADEKVRGRILKIRCKSCSNIITVKESAPSPISVAVGDSDRTVISSGPHIATRRPSPAPAPRGRPEGAGRAVRAATMPLVSAPAPTDEVQWFLAIEGVQTGPFSRKQLVDKLAGLPRDSDVHIWNDTLDGWKPPKDVAVIARDLQARQRPAPPAPPPSPRLRPVPPPPSHSGSAGHARGLPNPVGAAASPAVSHSSLGLGAASAALLPTATPAVFTDVALLVDTPAPIRELVQAHKAHNGTDAHKAPVMMGAAAPVAALGNGESDALQALNLGGSWRQPSSPDAVAEWVPSSPAAIAAAASARLKQRNLKLLTGAVVLASVCVGVLFIAMRKPPAPASAALSKGPAEPGATGVPGAAGKPSPGQTSTASASGAGNPARNAPTVTVADLRNGPPPTSDADLAAAAKAESVARISGKRGSRAAPGRGPAVHLSGGSTIATTTTGQSSLTPEQQAAANRFGETSTKNLQLRNNGPSAAKVTPAQGDITRVVNNNKGGIKVCYQRALLRDNSLTHGKIDVRVSIGISGRVKNVGIDGPSAFRSLDPCIKDVLSRWVFPASSEEYGTEFSYLFQGNE